MFEKFKPERPMKFPYTFSAKIAQFPWLFYRANNWTYKYYAWAFIVCLPIFKFFENLSKTPENQTKWAAIKLKEMQEHQHH